MLSMDGFRLKSREERDSSDGLDEKGKGKGDDGPRGSTCGDWAGRMTTINRARVTCSFDFFHASPCHEYCMLNVLLFCGTYYYYSTHHSSVYLVIMNNADIYNVESLKH